MGQLRKNVKGEGRKEERECEICMYIIAVDESVFCSASRHSKQYCGVVCVCVVHACVLCFKYCV